MLVILENTLPMHGPKDAKRNKGTAIASGSSDVIDWRARFQYSGFIIATKKCSCRPLQRINIPAMPGLRTGIGVHARGELYIYQYSSTACGSEMHYTSSNLHALHYTPFTHKYLTKLKIFTVCTKPH